MNFETTAARSGRMPERRVQKAKHALEIMEAFQKYSIDNDLQLFSVK